MAVADGRHDGDREEEGVGEVPVLGPALHLAVVVEVVGGGDDLVDEAAEVGVYLVVVGRLVEPLLGVIGVDLLPEVVGEVFGGIYDCLEIWLVDLN